MTIFIKFVFKKFVNVSSSKILFNHNLINLTQILTFSVNEGVVTFFGSNKKRDEKLLRAENLVKNWRGLFHPLNSCGSRSYALLGSLAELETALLEQTYKHLKKTKLFTVIEVNDILPLSTTKSCGVNVNLNINDFEQHTIQYILSLNNLKETFCLSGTAEMGIAHNLKDTTFNECDLPKFFMAKSRCFRPEVSTNTHESGLYRVHEFTKIEMFAVCSENQSENVLRKLVNIQKDIFSKLNVYCRLREMPSEDLNVATKKKFDIEAWMPGRQVWGEVSSASNCTDYQTKRLKIYYKNKFGDLKYAHTCNGTALASTRALIALLETHQNSVSFFF